MIDTVPPNGHHADVRVTLRDDGAYELFVGTAEFGNGTTTDPAGRVQVTGLANATQVAAGGRFSLAVHTALGLLGS